MPAVVRAGDTATGHTDIQGHPVTGTVSDPSCAQHVRNGGEHLATAATFVTFPSHAHALDEFDSPTSYRSHSVLINATGRHRAQGSKVAVNGDTVPVADEAGPNATLIATSTSLRVAN